MDNQLPNFPVQSQNYIAPNSFSPQIPGIPGDAKTSKFNLNKKMISIILIVFLLITLPVIAYLLIKQQGAVKNANLAQSMNSVNVTPSAPTNTPIPTPTVAPVATDSGTLIATPAAAWKVYINTKYTFSIEYPTTWYNSEFTDKTGSAFASTGIPTTTASQEIRISAIAKVDNANLSFADYVKVAGIKEFGYKNLASIKTITTASGVPGYETTWTTQGSTQSLPITYFEIPNDKTATIEVFLEKAEDLDIYNKILLTFKLTQ